MSHVHASVNARPYETSEAEKFELSIPEADEPPMSGKSRTSPMDSILDILLVAFVKSNPFSIALQNRCFT